MSHENRTREAPSDVDEYDSRPGLDDAAASDVPEEITAQLELLAEENRRLRAEYARARQVSYRRAAVGLGVLGLAALAGGVLFPVARTVLFVLAGIGLFAGVVTYYLTPERLVPATVGERVYAAFATSLSDLVADLGLSEARVYVPTDATSDDLTAAVRLFVPQSATYDLPTAAELRGTFVVSDSERRRGVALRPTGDPLYAEFERAASQVPETPEPLLDALVDALANQFELVETARVDVDVGSDGENRRATVAVAGSAYGAIDRFDHPVVSLLATGLADRLDRPIRVEVDTPEDDRFDALVTCRWRIEE